MKYNGHSESKVQGNVIPFRLDGELDAIDKLVLAARSIVHPVRCPNDGRRLRVDGSMYYEGEIGKDAKYAMKRVDREYTCPKCHLVTAKAVDSSGSGYIVNRDSDGKETTVAKEIVVPIEDGKIVVFLSENGKSNVGMFGHGEIV